MEGIGGGGAAGVGGHRVETFCVEVTQQLMRGWGGGGGGVGRGH